MSTEIYTTNGQEQTVALASSLAATLRPGDAVALYGGLGAGKTAFVRGLALGLGIDEACVTSPTFSLVNEYHGGKTVLYHFDMYRVTDEDALCSTGFFDYLDSGGILAVEWSENIPGALPSTSITVALERGKEESQRKITIIRAD